ncbi:MAG TPA: cystathionine gamma-synthase [Acidimicrobiales bacterium]|jgi:cystathionine gamma-synthase|nr:cystathionine gamma-synthase [Acidimicrobiales bacterium]
MTGFNTRAVHVGSEPDPATGAVNPAVYLTSTYAQDAVGVVRFSDYARGDNPTRAALEACLSDLEGAAYGIAFASGLAGEDALLRTLAPGDHVILGDDAYGGTYRLITRIFGAWGVKVDTVDLGDAAALDAAFTESTRMLWVETPSNPMLSVVSIRALADIAHAHSALLVVDNTFATPYLQRPLALGADVIVHSTTKYVGGHSDVIGGFVATNDEEIAAKLRFHQYAIGAVPGPLDCYLLLRGLKTLGIRMDRHCANAEAIAAFLVEHAAVRDVYYPGLVGHAGHEIARTQMKSYGGMVSFTVRGGVDVAKKICESTSIFILAESLGGVESLIELPSAMTHLSASGSALEPPADLIRLSVGIEDVDDLIADLDRALSL